MAIDRSALMADAHARFRRRRGTAFPITFGEALRRAWAAAKLRQTADEARGRVLAPVGHIRPARGQTTHGRPLSVARFPADARPAP